MAEQQDLTTIFQKAMNTLALLHCNVPDALDRTAAEERLQQLAALWQCDERTVAEYTLTMAATNVDLRTLYFVRQATKALHIPITPDEIKERWNELSESEKYELVNGLATVLEEEVI